VRAIAIYGGKDVEEQVQALREGAAVVVGTPGRLSDVLNRGVLSLSRVRTIVLDEADELLDRGFAKDLELLLQAAPAERQTILASATMPPAVERLVKRWMKEPERVSISLGAPAASISHFWVQAHPRHKLVKLVHVLANQAPDQAIVFVAKREDTEHVARGLRREGFTADWIHGEMAQPHRQQVMDRFRNHEIAILVATDLAARGLDVPGVSHVINYDVPMNPEIYVHRVGRTGRAGETGIAITLVGSDERFSFSKIRAGFPVKELKGKVSKPPRDGNLPSGPARGEKPEGGKPDFRKPEGRKPFAGKPQAGKPEAGKHAQGKHAPGKDAPAPHAPAKHAPPQAEPTRRSKIDPDLPPGWVLDDEPAKPVKKDGRPPRAIAKKGPGLDWDADRRGNPRRGRKPPRK
jgi:superfamily II DNA/RNA helicase